MSVEYRNKGDMTVWARSLLGTNTTPKVVIEWSKLFGE
jgi:hypothetical protein